jgi:hypothetical protein
MEAPHILLQDPNGGFSQLVENTGETTANYLKSLALKAEAE